VPKKDGVLEETPIFNSDEKNSSGVEIPIKFQL
jgi:hypothetical protein